MSNPSRKCNFLKPTDNKKCGRPTDVGKGGRCDFHQPIDAQKIPGTDFLDRLILLDSENDGDWVGFVFPDLVVSPSTTTFNTAIDLRHAQFGTLSLPNVSFMAGMVADYAHAHGDFFVGGSAISTFSLTRAKFEKRFRLNMVVDGSTNINFGEFSGPVEVRGKYSGCFNANSAVFRDQVDFRGGWHHYASIGSADPPPKSERRPLFADELQFQSVFLESPSKLRMETLTLERAYLAGTNFVGAQFSDISWAEPQPGRKGIYDEIFATNAEGENTDRQLQPRVESAYRNLRLTLEQNREFSLASDFYVGEMLARKRFRTAVGQRRNWIENMYGNLSKYGSSPGRAFIWFVGLFLAHAIISQIVICTGQSATCQFSPSFPESIAQVTHSLKIMTLQRFVSVESTTDFRTLLDTIFMILAPIQFALLILAFRGRIRR